MLAARVKQRIHAWLHRHINSGREVIHDRLVEREGYQMVRKQNSTTVTVTLVHMRTQTQTHARKPKKEKQAGVTSPGTISLLTRGGTGVRICSCTKRARTYGACLPVEVLFLANSVSRRARHCAMLRHSGASFALSARLQAA